MRLTFGSGSLSSCLGLVGTGLAMAVPTQSWIGWIVVAFGLLVFLLDIKIDSNHIEWGGLPNGVGRRMIWAQYGMIVCAIGFALSVAAYLWPSRVDPAVQTSSKNVHKEEIYDTLPTFREIFGVDFIGSAGVGKDFQTEDEKSHVTTTFSARVIYDFNGRTKILAVYLPNVLSNVATTDLVINNVDKIMSEMNFVVMTSKIIGDTRNFSTKDFIFTNTIYIYYEGDMSLQDQAQSENYASSKGYFTQYRGQSYYLSVAKEVSYINAVKNAKSKKNALNQNQPN